jgi:hypothetical protein
VTTQCPPPGQIRHAPGASRLRSGPRSVTGYASSTASRTRRRTATNRGADPDRALAVDERSQPATSPTSACVTGSRIGRRSATRSSTRVRRRSDTAGSRGQVGTDQVILRAITDTSCPEAGHRVGELSLDWLPAPLRPPRPKLSVPAHATVTSPERRRHERHLAHTSPGPRPITSQARRFTHNEPPGRRTDRRSRYCFAPTESRGQKRGRHGRVGDKAEASEASWWAAGVSFKAVAPVMDCDACFPGTSAPDTTFGRSGRLRARRRRGVRVAGGPASGEHAS